MDLREIHITGRLEVLASSQQIVRCLCLQKLKKWKKKHHAVTKIKSPFTPLPSSVQYRNQGVPAGLLQKEIPLRQDCGGHGMSQMRRSRQDGQQT